MRMDTPRKAMVISHWWAQVAILTFLAGFAVLGVMAYKVYTQGPPIPERVVTDQGEVLFTGRDILAGQQVFRKYGLMQHGTIFGHGAYLGPDFTAEYLHRAAAAMLAFYAGPQRDISPAVRQRVRDEIKGNTWDAQKRTVTYTPGQVRAYDAMVEYYTRWFGPLEKQQGLKRPYIRDPQEIRDLTRYFSWAAWTCSTKRPEADYSYTNNWPAEAAAANAPTSDAVVWSALSLVALLCGAGVVFFLFGRYSWLGWHREAVDRQPKVVFTEPGAVALTPSQRMTAWYFLVVAGLFLAQGLLGGANAHYHAAPAGIGGAAVAQWLPYNLTRTWHVQLALFFLVASFLARGIFIPMIARRGKTPGHAGPADVRGPGRHRGCQPDRGGRQHQGLFRPERPMVLDRQPGVGVPRPGQAVADSPGRRHGVVAGDCRTRPVAQSARRASGQHAVSVPLQRPVDPAVLRGRPGHR
jgi:nitric oxide reductase subunit B